MSEQELIGTSPNGIRNIAIDIENHKGDVYDITGTVSEISLYESIYVSYIHGDMAVVDNSNMLSDFPFIGQERVRIRWERDEKISEREFLITKVSSISRNRDGFGVYGLKITSEIQMRNATSLFSKSYRGSGDKIIKDIFSEHLNTELVGKTKAKTSHNIVFPYMKPLQAVDMVMKNVLADDNTPMFVYSTFYPNETRLESFAEMYAKEPTMKLKPTKPTNDQPDGQATEGSLKQRGVVYDMAISRAYDIFDDINKGAYGSFVTIADASTSEYQRPQFDFKKEAPTLASEWITSDYTQEGEPLNNIPNTTNNYLYRNQYAFNTDLPNLNTVDDFDISILNSYTDRHAMTVLKVYIDSVAYVLETGEPFGVGQTVDYVLPKFSPVLGEEDRKDDEVNSGKYIVSAMRHYIKGKEYTMSLELIRDGVGEIANLDPLIDTSEQGKEGEKILPNLR